MRNYRIQTTSSLDQFGFNCSYKLIGFSQLLFGKAGDTPFLRMSKEQFSKIKSLVPLIRKDSSRIVSFVEHYSSRNKMTTELYEKSTLKRINIKRHTSMEEFLFLILYPLTNTNPTFILPANMFGIRFILSVLPPHEKQYPEFFIACKCCVSFDLLQVKIGHYLFYGPC